MTSRESILVFRFSAMGDVAMSAAVVREFALQNPDVRIIMVSRANFAPFFGDIESVVFHPLEAEGKHKGIVGLFTLFQELKQYQAVAIADLHHNLRSRILGYYFKVTGIHIERLNKNRNNKKRLTQKNNKVVKPLLGMVEAYADVFKALGFPLHLSHQLIKQERPVPPAYRIHFENSLQLKIGISPFAQHTQKVYPLAKMEEVIASLSNSGHQLFILGGGASEKAVAEDWAKTYPLIENLIGKLSLQEELNLISHLDLMVSMDSAGMHMASLMGIKTVSIWGATHPYAGFLGYGQSEEDCVQLDLSCRPCSVYGNKPCYRGDFACMQGLNSGIIIAQINKTIMSLPNLPK